MNFLDLPFNLADLPLIGMLMGLLLWSIATAFVLLVVELLCLIGLTVRSMGSRHPGKSVTGKP
jgi:hypothetical protein